MAAQQARLKLADYYKQLATVTTSSVGLSAAQPWYRKLDERLSKDIATAKDDTAEQAQQRAELYSFLADNTEWTIRQRTKALHGRVELAKSRSGEDAQVALAEAYNKLGSFYGRIERPDTAYEWFTLELPIRQTLVAKASKSDSATLDLGFVNEWLADVCRFIGRTKEAVSSGDECVKVYADRQKAMPDEPDARARVGWGYYYYGTAEERAGHGSLALNAHERAVSLVSTAQPRTSAAGNMENGLAYLYLRLGRMQEADRHAGQEVLIREELAKGADAGDTALEELSRSYELVGAVKSSTGDRSGAIDAFQKALNVQLRRNDQDSTEKKAARAGAQQRLANANLKAGKLQKAIGPLRESLIHLEARAADEDNIRARDSYISCLEDVAIAEARAGRTQAAQEAFQRALKMRQEVVNKLPASAWYAKVALASSQKASGAFALMRGDASTALELDHAALKLETDYAGADPVDADAKAQVCGLQEGLGAVSLEQGQLGSAREFYQKALAGRRDLDKLAQPADGSVVSVATRANIAQDLLYLGRLEMAGGDFSAATAELLEGQKILSELDQKGLLKNAQYRKCLAAHDLKLAVCKVAADGIRDPKAVTKQLEKSKDTQREVLRDRAILMARRKQYDEVQKTIDLLNGLGPEDGPTQFQVACCYAECARAVQRGRKRADLKGNESETRQKYVEESLRALSKAFDRGFADVSRMLFESDLDFIRPEDGYRRLVDRVASHEH
jgi:tetratricopeptide (TPR) repeat protein